MNRDERNITALRAFALVQRCERAIGSNDHAHLRGVLIDVNEALRLHVQAALARRNRRRKR